MNDDDLFSGGFGNQQQPFSLDIGEMDPFSDGTSPWGEVGGSLHVETVRRDETDDEGEETLPNKFEQLDVASNESSRETSNTASQELEKTGVAAHKELAEETDTSPIASPGTAPPTSPTSKDQLATRASPLGGYGVQVQAARRVGVIRRGLRSPRMLDSQQSSSSDPFVDPLSSAAAAAESGEPGGISAASAGAAATAGRASLDVPPSQAAARRGNMGATRQTRSQSRASLADNTSGSVESGGVAAASSPPHPYEQQLAQAQQREQTANARQQIEGGKSRTSTPSSERLSSGSAGGNRTSTSRVYLGAHQRRKSLDPTPADQMPRFSIHVMDPVKVSDSLKSYIAYKVKTQSSAAMFRESEMIVRRRYRDFDWLTQELAARHPGIIVPAIPEKQSMGRFEDEFVESRRAGLESCLTRIAEHPVLWCDDAFRLFLEADDFASKARAITELRIASEINGTSVSLGGSSSGSGLFGDGWGGAKYKEKDEWFMRRMQELDAVEQELRALLRALEYGQRQRRELSIAHGELGEAYLKMAGQELNKTLSNCLTDMGSLQQKLKVLQSRQGVADFAAFQLTTDEYIRMIGAVRMAFAARGRAYTRWQNSLADLIKRRKVLEGYVQHQGRASPERLLQTKGEIARAEIRTEGDRNAFDDVSKLVKQEMVRFDLNRVRDFQAAVETYLTSLIDTQEEVVMLWDAYLTSLRNTGYPPSSSETGGPSM